jgi:cyanophycinase
MDADLQRWCTPAMDCPWTGHDRSGCADVRPVPSPTVDPFQSAPIRGPLISAVLDRPDLVGVGIDEATAVFVRGSRIEVVGAGAVVVVDARGAAVPRAPPGQVVGGTGLRLHVLREGMTLDLEKR